MILDRHSIESTEARSGTYKSNQIADHGNMAELTVSIFCTTLWIGRRRTRRDYPIKTSRPKSSKYLSSNTSDRSVMQKWRRYCHDRTLTDGFRGSAMRKMQPFFPRHRQLFILPHATMHSRCCIRSHAIDALPPTGPTWYLIKIAYDISIALNCIQICTILIVLSL